MGKERCQQLRTLVENKVLSREEYMRLVHGSSVSFSGCLLYFMATFLGLISIFYAIKYSIATSVAHEQYQAAVSASDNVGAREIIRNEPYVFDSGGERVGTNVNYIAYVPTVIEGKMALKLNGIDTPLRDIKLDSNKMSEVRVSSDYKPILLRVILRGNRYADVMFFPLSSQWLYARTLNEVTIPVKDIMAFRGGAQPAMSDIRGNSAVLTEDEDTLFFELFCDEADATRFGWDDMIRALPHCVYNRYHPWKSIAWWAITLIVISLIQVGWGNLWKKDKEVAK